MDDSDSRETRRLSDRVALVTGAGTGIGQAIAIRLAQEGASVAINYRKSRQQAEETAERVERVHGASRVKGGRHMLVQGDVSREEDVRRIFDEVVRAWGRLDILVNNAGIQKASTGHETPTEDYDKTLSVNLRGAFLCSREAIKHFLRQGGGGVIVNNSSVHEVIPRPKYVAYSVSKAGMAGLTKTLALEYADRGIRVNAVGPGAIATPINKAWTDDPRTRAEVERHIPMGRAGKPEEIAAVVAFLVSEDASYVTGQTIFACGGLTLYPDFRTPWSGGD